MSAKQAKTAKHTTPSWAPDSWRALPIRQQPEYGDKEALLKVEGDLAKLPPLVTPYEVQDLRADLAKVAAGQAFLLQGGDCAESFAEFNHRNLQQYFRVLLQMTVALMYGAGTPVIKVGRIAGQFAKPRSAGTEMVDGVEYPAYRGDIVNSIDADMEGRQPDPARLLQAYNQASATLNYLRGLAKGGFASLKQISEWNTEFISRSPQARRFKDLVQHINDCLGFIEACGLHLDDMEQLKEARFFTSHEGLLLNYEQAFTRQHEIDGQWYDLSAHMVWIGDRTRELGEAHIEYMRGIANPVGMKVGPSITGDDLINVIDALNPDNIPGKLVLISRMGAGKIGESLPALVRRVKQEGRHVVWSSDPMHGNTIKSPNGIKTRRFNDILSELKSFFAIHEAEGTIAGGVHFEMTGQDVTECLGGAQAISELDLHARYHTHCDPRMNASQSLEMAFLIAEELKKRAQERRSKFIAA
jgi:3-deoxy-7-phosphoheptulonate synthase